MIKKNIASYFACKFSAISGADPGFFLIGGENFYRYQIHRKFVPLEIGVIGRDAKGRQCSGHILIEQDPV
jgi:hypothetical protein